jgi:hypothetical protein
MADYRAIKSLLSANLVNIPGWQTFRKIVVIESDDWGSIRMPSNEVYSKFTSRGFNISTSDYNRFDTLENNDDLTLLYHILLSNKDTGGNPAVITANIVVGNPDFQKIRESDFSDYYFEPVLETLRRYPQRDQVESLWKQGNDYGVSTVKQPSPEMETIISWRYWTLIRLMTCLK